MKKGKSIIESNMIINENSNDFLGSFHSLTKLKSLDVSGCGKLQTIDKDAFSGCIDLERVTISLNRVLSHISEGAFDRSMTQLKVCMSITETVKCHNLGCANGQMRVCNVTH